MTTQPAQPEATQPPPMPERVSRLEGITEQVNLRLAENAGAINTLRAEFQALRAENHAEHQALREEMQAGHEALHANIEEQGREFNAKFDRLRGEMHRQTVLVVGILGGLMALLRFAG